MNKEYKNFEIALDKVKGTFLREYSDFKNDIVDFQHPSIRDML